MALKGQLHTHSTFSDGSMTPQELADAYAAMGYDFLAVTDHDHLLTPGYREALQAIRSPLLVFFGIELTVHTSKGYVHVGRIEGDRDALHVFNHPADYDLDLRQTLACLREVARRHPLDAVEITDHGFYTPAFDIAAISYPRIAADDAHHPPACGRGWVEVDAPPDKDAILAALRQGRFRNGFAGQRGSMAPWRTSQRFPWA